MSYKSTTYKVSEAAEILGVSTQTVRNYGKSGKLTTMKTPGGQIVYMKDEVNAFAGIGTTPDSDAPAERVTQDRTVFYIRTIKRGDAQKEQQAELTKAFGEPDGVYKDVSSGLCETRKGLDALLKDAADGEFRRVCVACKDRLATYGADYISRLLGEYGVTVQFADDRAGAAATADEHMQEFLGCVATYSGKVKYLRGYDNQKELLDDAKKIIEKKQKEAAKSGK